MKKLTEKEFLEKCILIHGDVFDFSEFNYVNTSTKGKCICKKCGYIWYVKPNTLLNGHGCRKCYDKKNSFNKTLTLDEVNERLNDCVIIGNYINTKNRASVKCLKCGTIWTPFVNDILRGHGCPNCNKPTHYTSTTEEFIEKAKQKHNNKYDYSKVNYINNRVKVCIVCPEHGEFWQTPNAHLNGNACPKCKGFYRTNEEFIKKLNSKFKNENLLFDKIEYKNTRSMLTITCKRHGDFISMAKELLNGCGCPKCNISLLEKKVMQILEKKNIKYDYQKKFEWLKTSETSSQSYDFYLPDYKTAIECQGIQHFKPIELFGGEEVFNKQIKLDEIKREKSLENNITLKYVNYNDNVQEKMKIILNEIT